MGSTPTLALTQGPAQGVAPLEPGAHSGLALPAGCGLGPASAWLGDAGVGGLESWCRARLIESACWLGLCKGFPVAFIIKCFTAPNIPPCWPLGLTFS